MVIYKNEYNEFWRLLNNREENENQIISSAAGFEIL